VPVTDAYVDVHGPRLGSVLRAGDVVVPLLLSPGHHTEVDIAEAAQSFFRVEVRPPLGPSTRLVSVLHHRLVRAGLRPGDGVVLAGAGSSRPGAAAAVRAVADDLACAVRRPVQPAFISPPPDSDVPSVTDAVAAVAASCRRVVAVPYLLAPGAFLERLRHCGADVVAGPLLHPHRVEPLLTELVLTRAALAHGAAL
jgi:sirohydrochlorin ferrochelatase